jgi:PAS domain S-box-containing protein
MMKTTREYNFQLLMNQTSFGFAYLRIVPNTKDNSYDFVIEEVNPAFEKITGIPEKLAMGAGMSDFFDDGQDESAQKQQLLRQVVIEKSSVEAEMFAHKLERWLKISASPMGSDHIGVIFSDITPRKQAEEKFATAFRLAPHTITITDVETGRLVDANDAFVSITGYSREETIGKTTLELDIWANHADRDEVFADLRSGLEVRAREYSFKNQNGQLLHGLFSASIVQINNKAHILSSIEDITERKKARLALEEENRKTKALIDALPDMIFIMGKDGSILDVYGAKPKLLVAPVEELIGCSIRKIFPKEEYERHIEIYEACLREGTTASIEFELGVKDKKMFFESRVSPLDNNRLLTVVRDITESRQMQQTLKDELAYRNFLFETDREGLLIMSNDHRVIDANKKICEMLGYSFEEMLQLYTWDLDALNNREQILTNFDNSQAVDARFESVHQRKDGSTYDVEVSARSFNWKGERMIFCACRDISDRKKLEQETIQAKNLAEVNQKRFDEIADYTGEFVWEVNAEGIYTYANSAVKTLLGYEPEELVGKMNCIELLTESEKSSLTSETEKIFESKAPISNLENTMLTKNGSVVRVVTNGIPITGPEGELLGYRGSDRDITQQYEVEIKLKASENKYRMLVENVSDVLFTLKPDGTISYISPTVKNLTGYETEDYIGNHFSAFIHKADLETVAYDFEQIKTGNYYPSEYRINTKNGTEVWVRSSTKAVDETTYTGIARDITQEVKAARALKESEAQYRMLFNANMDSLSIVYIEPDGSVSNFVGMNDAGAAIIGYTKEELLNKKSPADIEIGASPSAVQERIKQLQEKGEAVFEATIRNKNGEDRSLEIKAILISYKNKPAILNISRDITERKKAEIALKESELFANLVANSTPAMLYIYNLEKQCNVWSNEAHKAYFSEFLKNHKELRSVDIEKVVHPDDFEQLMGLLGGLLVDKTKQQISLEIRILGENKWIWMNLLLSKFRFDESGETLEIMGAIFEIDDRKKAELELQQNNSNATFLNKMALKLVNLQAGASVGQETIPDIRQYTGAVFAMHSQFDFSQQAFFIKHIDADSKLLNAVFKVAGNDILKKPTRLSKEVHKQVAESNVIVYESLHELTFGDVPEVVSKAIGAITGVSRIHALVHAMSGKIYGGTFLGFRKDQPEPSFEMLRSYAYLVAITLRRIFAEEELVVAKEKAEESNRLKSAFLASISHELRTPLNHVIGFSDLIKSEVTDPEIHKYASIIFDSGTNFLTMIEDILALALAEQSEIKLRMQSFKGMDIFLENRNLLHEILNNSGKTEDIKLHFKPEAAVLANIYTSDRLKINQVLANLFKNAVKYTHKGSITFGMRQDDEETLTFYVADTGIGIAKDKLDVIFEFFRQGDDSHTRLYDGLGIGLAISRQIAFIMGANLYVESTEGKGTVFYFSLPIGFIGDMSSYQEAHN